MNSIRGFAYHSLGNEVLYTNTISPADEATADFKSELEASLVYITAPTGAIAMSELQGLRSSTASEYSCFLSIENNRAREGTMAELIDRCIALYPHSNYAAFWHARRAFALYQTAAANGEPIRKEGAAWAELNRALEMSPTNSFANFVAAKVELASGRCDSALAYVDRALERGGSYPALVASASADGAACNSTDGETAETSRRLRALARFTPDPDPLLHLYLMLALLAVDDKPAAQAIADAQAIGNPTGSLELATNLLRRSLTDPAFAAENKDELQSAVELYIWNRELSDDIVDRVFN